MKFQKSRVVLFSIEKQCDFSNLAKKRSSGEDRANCALQDGMDGFSGDSSIRKKNNVQIRSFFHAFIEFFASKLT